jgi:ribosomal protein S12 methylthiotransferase
MPSPGTATNQDIQTVAFVSLGCPKNLVDSEKMLGLLAEDGLLPVPSDEAADAVVINTCGFLEASKEESLGEIRDAIERKQRGETRRVIVAGCLVQRHRAKLLEWAPEIDALIGVFDRDKITDAVRGASASPGGSGTCVPVSKTREAALELPVFSSIATNATLAKTARGIDDEQHRGYFEDDSARLRLTPRHYAFLRMSEGCNQNCAFCTIPSIRGKMRSKPVDRIASEMRELLADGAFEINLIGQDTTSYGNDIGYEPGLVGLLETLNKVAAENGGAWVRLMYAYPSCFTDEMIDAIARLPNVLKYIDMPLQHINDTVLDHMRRKTSRKLIETLLAKLRDRVPGIAIRTTFISGFPGETDAQHDELVRFIEDFGFDNLGVFPYSPEPGTPAGTMHADPKLAVPDDVIEQRIEQIMTTQQEVVFARNEQLAAQRATFDALIDAPLDLDNDKPRAEQSEAPDTFHYTARTYTQAPDIDALTLITSRTRLAPGELTPVTVTGSEGYDLHAQPTADLHRQTSLTVLK